MRILIVVSDFPKVTETFVLANARHFLARGHDLGVFHLKPFRHGEVTHPDAAHVVARGIGLPWITGESLVGLLWGLSRPALFLPVVARLVAAFWREPSRLTASLAILPKSLAMARQLRRDGTAHIHAEFAGYPATAAWIISTFSGVPFSFSAHAHDIFLTQGLLATKARAARFVRAISRFNKDFIEAVPGVPAGQVEVLHCGVALGNPAPLPPPPDATIPLRLLFVGALLPRKGVQHLIAALAALPEDLAWHLDVIGGGSMEPALRAQAAPLADRITFHGPRDAGAVRAAMRAAHAVIVPSVEGAGGRSEGIPVVLMEALAEARPVVTSRLSGIPELVVDGETGFLTEPGDEAALTRALMSLASDYPAAAAMGRRGRAKVEAEFDIDETAEALLRRIEETTP
ncbi:glycosyltransferase family 4 protein [Maritimibacter sp. DP1N21-5]|uniref:glycosyltransferase family 4 protein n=1 Tax=Maritimibacter sp. DP1N21-5 TaxID=2836867 RepID=UPI001C47E149|nr:glycosyltransferase family 4 protein [Maritimibacter sp. DP1N21-5]MBV7410688.1 glycosyltransferase family 4 protein [Maritimibacter sp. DP1N21-5]